MPKMVSFVFKVLIMTLIIATLVTLTASIIDIFITTTRIQSLAQMIQYDVAQNNCLLNDTYTGFKQELYNISNRSNHMKVCCDGDTQSVTGYEDAVQKNANVQDKPAMQLFVPAIDNTASQKYIQTPIKETGVLIETKADLSALQPKEFGVANYGDIMKLNINTVLNPTMFAMPKGGSISDTATYALNGIGGSPLTLTFTIPALTYIK